MIYNLNSWRSHVTDLLSTCAVFCGINWPMASSQPLATSILLDVFFEVMLLGEVASKATVSYEQVIRETVKAVGYDNEDKGLDWRTMNVTWPRLGKKHGKQVTSGEVTFGKRLICLFWAGRVFVIIFMLWLHENFTCWQWGVNGTRRSKWILQCLLYFWCVNAIVGEGWLNWSRKNSITPSFLFSPPYHLFPKLHGVRLMFPWKN